MRGLMGLPLLRLLPSPAQAAEVTKLVDLARGYGAGDRAVVAVVSRIRAGHYSLHDIAEYEAGEYLEAGTAVYIDEEGKARSASCARTPEGYCAGFDSPADVRARDEWGIRTRPRSAQS